MTDPAADSKIVLAGPALGILELGSIARGYVALDAASKRADVTVLRAEPITPGKYWLALSGGEAEVEESLAAAVSAAKASRIDSVLLAYVHEAVGLAVAGAPIARCELLSVGAIELSSIASAVRAADAAVKAAQVSLVDLHLARGIGGKGYVVVSGDLSDVEAAVDAGVAAAGESWLVGREVIANPDAPVHRAASTRGAR
ncbi:MAG: BMC domain-containing protein [Myxococcales bacterium]|nr:BMC domain-containing protein [Myxococcales bacterium]